MHITVWMAGNAFKIDRISRLEEDWNGRYAASAARAPLFKFEFNPSLIDGILNVLPYELA